MTMRDLKLTRYGPVLFLVAANAVVLVQLVRGAVSSADAMWIYWCQSVAIGLANVTRMLLVRRLPGPPGLKAEQFFAAVFFAAHYGLFHYGYFMFLSRGGGPADRLLIAYNAVPFLIMHLFPFFYHYRPGPAITRDLRVMMLMPYSRILPMHIAIVLGGSLAAPILIFLKTICDVAGHLLEHLVTRAPLDPEKKAVSGR